MKIFTLVLALVFVNSAKAAPALTETVGSEAGPFSTINVKTNFAHLVQGDWNVALDFAVFGNLSVQPFWINLHGTRTITAGPADALTQNDRFASSMQVFGVGANYYITGSRNYNGLFISPFIGMSVNTLRLDQIGRSWEGNQLGYVVGMTAHYQWMFSSGLNLNLGFGLMKWGPTSVNVIAFDNASLSQESPMPGSTYSGWEPSIQVNGGFAL